MLGINNNKLYVACIILVILVITVFLINYQINRVVKEEIGKYHKRKALRQRKMMMKRNKMMEQENRQQHAMQENGMMDNDSYMDPVDRHQQDDDDEPNNEEFDNNRLSKENIGMRAFMQ